MIPNDRVKHVIVLMLENRSFDHILGDLRIDDLNGIVKNGPQRNVDVDGNSMHKNQEPYESSAMTRSTNFNT